MASDAEILRALAANKNDPLKAAEMIMASGWFSRRSSKEKAARYKHLVELYEILRTDSEFNKEYDSFQEYIGSWLTGTGPLHNELDLEMRMKAAYYLGYRPGKAPDGMDELDHGILKGRDSKMAVMLAFFILKSLPKYSKYLEMVERDEINRKAEKEARDERYRIEVFNNSPEGRLKYHTDLFLKIREKPELQDAIENFSQIDFNWNYNNETIRDELPPDLYREMRDLRRDVVKYEAILIGRYEDGRWPFADLRRRDDGVFPISRDFVSGDIVVEKRKWVKDGVEYDFSEIPHVLAVWHFKNQLQKFARVLSPAIKSANKTESDPNNNDEN